MMKWNSALYDNKHDFVAEYGKELLELLPDHRHLAVLDLGCGTATLTAQLAGRYDKVTGVDSSQEMLDKARAQFGNIESDCAMHLICRLQMSLTSCFLMLCFIGLATMICC